MSAVLEPENTSTTFDLGSATGVNASERLLTQLCHQSFLRLWAHANLYTDEDLRDGKGSAKELSDALVVFGDDVIIFSDKHIEFQEHKPLEVAWKRWYKRAVDESTKQLFGARSWLQRFPDRVFLDAKCTRPIPVAMPGPQQARYHLVAVTRGTKAAVAARFGGIGSLLVSTDVVGVQHLDRPFTIGRPAPERGFVHVFDEASLEVLMEEMDTAPDFLGYLTERAKFLGKAGRVVQAPGEEELIASYLLTTDEADEHRFVHVQPGDDAPDLVTFDGTHYQGMRTSPAYQRKVLADANSYLWDKLIDRFISVGDPDILDIGTTHGPPEVEFALRHLASASRLRRRMLTAAWIGLMEDAMDTNRVARISSTLQQPHLAYIFLVVQKRADETHEEFRHYRVSLLSAYCQTAKLVCPHATTFVGLAFDHPRRDYVGGSEDLMVWTQREWNDEHKARLEKLRAEVGILGPDIRVTSSSHLQFPPESPWFGDEPPKPASRTDQAAKQRKRMDKLRAKSKRQNRRRR